MNTLIIAHSFSEHKIEKLSVGLQVTADINAFYEKVIHEYKKFNPHTKKHEDVTEEVCYVRTTSGDRFAARAIGDGQYITVPMY